MSLLQELKDCYINKNGSADEIISNRSKKLTGDKEKGLFKATAKLLGAYCASPAFSKSKQLDVLAEGDRDMKILRFLIRCYGQGAEKILDTYDNYFSLEEKQEFWKFFNKELSLPDDWYKLAEKETHPVSEIPFGTGLDDYGDAPDIYPDDFDEELNKMLDEKGV